MSDNEFVASEAEIATVFAFAGLTVPADRLAANYEVYSSTLALIREVSAPGLGEIVPAVAFTASWD
jgi:hypothetical protein